MSLRDRLNGCLNDHLCGMKEGYDDSIVGFNEAWEVMRKTFDDVHRWQPINTSPSDNSEIWLSDGKTVWLGTAHADGSLKLPSRWACRFWMPADKPTPPQEAGDARVVGD
jgi:hypothetical protein